VGPWRQLVSYRRAPQPPSLRVLLGPDRRVCCLQLRTQITPARTSTSHAGGRERGRIREGRVSTSHSGRNEHRHRILGDTSSLGHARLSLPPAADLQPSRCNRVSAVPSPPEGQEHLFLPCSFPIQQPLLLQRAPWVLRPRPHVGDTHSVRVVDN